MKLYDLFQRIYRFNQYERDRWVAHQAKGIPSGSKVLDVGAGTSPYRAFFSHCVYKAHDFGLLSREHMRDREAYGKIDYRSDILSIPVEDASFDAVICTEVLEHVPEPVMALRELQRILRQGGLLLLTAPLGSGIHQEPYHFYGGFTPYWYERFLSESGFVGIRVDANGGFFKHYGQESIRFAKTSSPWKIDASKGVKFCWSLLWVISLPIFLIFLPIVGYLLDPFDKDRLFTVGYFVTASKAGPQS